MGWKITRDYLHESYVRDGYKKDDSDSMKGRQSRDFIEGTDQIRIKVYDGDGILYYEAVCSNEDVAERFYEWAMYDSGCTSSKIKEKGKEWQNFIG